MHIAEILISKPFAFVRDRALAGASSVLMPNQKAALLIGFEEETIK